MQSVKLTSCKALCAFCFPVHWLGKKIGRVLPHNEKAGHIVIGLILMMIGSTLASLNWPYVPHIVSDALSWLVHGFGCAPIINAVITE